MDPTSQLPPPQPPEQPQPLQQPQFAQPQNSIDYLNSIATPQRATTISPLKLWLMIGGGLLVIVIIFFALLGLTKGATPTDKFILYQYRLTQVSTIAKNNSSLIKSSDLRAFSGSMNSILVGALSESNGQLSEFGLKKAKQPAKTDPIIKEFSLLTTKLENADLNNNFDQVYAREMAYQMATLVAQINGLEAASSSKPAKASLETAKSNIQPFIKQYNDYNNSQG